MHRAALVNSDQHMRQAPTITSWKAFRVKAKLAEATSLVFMLAALFASTLARSTPMCFPSDLHLDLRPRPCRDFKSNPHTTQPLLLMEGKHRNTILACLNHTLPQDHQHHMVEKADMGLDLISHRTTATGSSPRKGLMIPCS